MLISWQGNIAQYVGRLHRLHYLKKEVQVYDYADLNLPILKRMFNKRCRGYEAVGYKILLPASATPGWPIQTPFPVDPAWKSDYAASIKRLICDGVDMPLANLFIQEASVMHADAKRASIELEVPLKRFFIVVLKLYLRPHFKSNGG